MLKLIMESTLKKKALDVRTRGAGDTAKILHNIFFGRDHDPQSYKLLFFRAILQITKQ